MFAVVYLLIPTAKLQFAMPMPAMPMPVPVPIPAMPMMQVPFMRPNPSAVMIAEIKFRKVNTDSSAERKEKEEKVRKEEEKVKKEKEEKVRIEKEERERKERDGSKIELQMSPVLMLMQPSMMVMPAFAMPPPMPAFVMPPPMPMPIMPPIRVIRPGNGRPNQLDGSTQRVPADIDGYDGQHQHQGPQTHQCRHRRSHVCNPGCNHHEICDLT